MIKRRIIILLVLSAMLLSACGNRATEDSSAVTTEKSETTASAVTTTPTETTTPDTTTTTTTAESKTETSTTTSKTTSETTTTTTTTTTQTEPQVSEEINYDFYDDYYSDNYNDSYNSYKAPVEVGYSFELGRYEQDNDKTNGKEPITWDILDVKDGKALVISHCVLDYDRYNAVYKETTWEDSMMRLYLNTDFYDMIFTDDEKELICDTVVSTPDNEISGRSGGNDTVDKLFCLSYEEVKKYFYFDYWNDETTSGWGKQLVTLRTLYAASQDKQDDWSSDSLSYESWLNSYINNFDNKKDEYKEQVKYILENYDFNMGSWWLRTPGSEPTRQCRVTFEGKMGKDKAFDMPLTWDCGIRPAMWIDVDKWLNY